jgi:regulator of sigma E protease
LTYVIAFIVLLGALVFFHELGHFLFARLFGVGVTTFSLGFGPTLVARKRGETTYRIAAVPLGGYVKMIGEDPTEDVDPAQRRVSFSHKPVWQRALIIAAGPAFNVAFAFLIFVVVFAVGYPRMLPIVGTVLPGSPAQAAGLRTGDRLVAVDGRDVATWEAMEKRIANSAGRALALVVDRDETRIRTTTTPVRARRANVFGAQEESWAIGISPDIEVPYVGVPDSSSAAGKAGLRTGDRIVRVAGLDVEYTYQVARALSARAGGTVPIDILREAPPPDAQTAPTWNTVSLSLPIPAAADPARVLADLGIENTDLYLLRVVPGGPADRAGFKAGDKVVEIGGKPATEQAQFLAYVRGSGEKDATFVVRRDGALVPLAVTPKLERRETETGEAVRAGRIGVVVGASIAHGVLGPERYRNPAKLIVAAASETGRWMVLTVQGIYYIAARQVSVKSLGGPLRIAKMAGDTAKTGLYQYIVLMAMISLNLAVINLVPMPVLDGGNLVLLAVEAVRRRPLSLRAIQAVQWVGIVFLVLLIVFIFYNDLSFFFPQIGESLQ